MHYKALQEKRDSLLEQRNSLTRQLHATEEELAKVRKDMKRAAANEKSQAAGVDLDKPITVILAAHRLFKKLIREGVELDAEELAVVDSLRELLRKENIEP